jgi:uncharacterized heparinase superfamily protein
VISKGLNWLSFMNYGNEGLPHFNDCSEGIAPTFNQLLSYASFLEIPINNIRDETEFTQLNDTGFCVVKKNGIHLIADIGKIGPDYIPGHAHADTLSFELAVNGCRLVVNHGTSCYGISSKRLFERGTLSHSTLCIDGHNSSDVWSGFRVGRRALPIRFEIKSLNPLIFSCGHNGYLHLENPSLHFRIWELNEGSLSIKDNIDGTFNFAISRFILHPDVAVKEFDTKSCILVLKNGNRIRFETSGEIKLNAFSYAEGFGKIRETFSIDVKCSAVTKSTFNFF